jgi:hypothetical protein
LTDFFVYPKIGVMNTPRRILLSLLVLGAASGLPSCGVNQWQRDQDALQAAFHDLHSEGMERRIRRSARREGGAMSDRESALRGLIEATGNLQQEIARIVERGKAHEPKPMPSTSLLRQWDADPENAQCWGLAAIADELDRLRREIAWLEPQRKQA